MTFLDVYSAKLIEYILAVTYLLMFVGFWKFVMSEPQGRASV